MDASFWTEQIDPIVRSHRWIVCPDAAAAATPALRQWAEMGVPRPLVIAGTAGTGELPDPELAEVIVLDTGGDSIMDGFRRYWAALENPRASLMERIDAWDPDGEALVLTQFLDDEFRLAGRRPYGERRPEWRLLEDKMIVDDLWDDAGVTRAQSLIVAATGPELIEAALALDEGSGTVWVADNRQGWHGGAEYARYVADPHRAGTTIEFFETCADRVRVMPFLDGVPCSIHGMVFPDAVIAGRPIEMLVYRRPETDRFRYAGLASTWDPPPARRTEMQDVARRVAAHLRDTVGYRGAMSIDGVMTSEGFRPTELNARFSPGIGVQGQAAGDLSLNWINRMLIEGEDLDYRAVDLGELIVDAADASRTIRALCPVDQPAAESTDLPIAIRHGGVVRAEDAEPHGTLTFGPSAQGGLVMVRIEPEHLPVGAPAASLVAEAFALADEVWDAGIGPVIAGEA